MSQPGKIDILLVDDQPGKLLALEAILADLGENLLRAESAEEALRLLLTREVAVVLVDVCMPRMDGFELAQMIRNHPRYKRTAIIFISAVHLSDADRLKGYDLGAVDYIPVPIIPEVLRAKVAIFVDLYRKSEELKLLNQELERRVAERTTDLESSNAKLRTSEQRFQQIAHAIDEVFWFAELSPALRMLYVSPAWERIWGRPTAEAIGGPEAWLATVHEGDRAALEAHIARCPKLREGDSWELEYRIVRPDGEVRWIHERARVIAGASSANSSRFVSEPLSAAGLSEDVTDRRAATRERNRLLAILEATPDFIATADARGRTRYLNPAARRMLGVAPDADLSGLGVLDQFEPAVAKDLLADAARSGDVSIWEGESVLATGAGQSVPVSQVVIAHRDPGGERDFVSTIARDITERKRAEEVLSRDRETLERLVAERTEALARSTERLRLADRMATMGTLCAGLGHDMGNLLLPVKLRLASIAGAGVPPEVEEDIAAIQKATEYLQRLARSLRLLAIDPLTEEVGAPAIDPHEWWAEAEGMLRNGVSKPTVLEGDIEPRLPAIHIGKAALTQIAFNLVQNAGDALRGQSNGVVRVRLESTDGGQAVLLTLSDNGPGMDEQTLRRCTEPFFTRKTRSLSTGLGLTLVNGLVQRAGGSLSVTSEAGRGTAFYVRLRASTKAQETPAPDGAASDEGRIACVDVRDARVRAHAESVLGLHGFRVVRADGQPPPGSAVWVVEAPDAASAIGFARDGDGRHAIVLGHREGPGDLATGVQYVEPDLKPSDLRARLRSALARIERAESHV